MGTQVKARRSRVSRKNQVTLPVAELVAARIGPGDEVVIRADGDGRLVVERAGDPLAEFIGAVPGLSAATNLPALRAEWER